MDGSLDGLIYDKREQTGLLTRFVPDKLKGGRFYRMLLRATRALQFISSVVSLGLFSQRLYKVYRLVNSIKTRRGVNGAYGAVEGILAAAVLYTLISTLLGCIKKSANPGGRTLRWIWVLLDILFVGAFIAVAVLTRPKGGLAGARHCYSPSRLRNGGSSDVTGETADPNDDSCNLPWGTFILAIVSTLLHAITAAFHEIKDHRRRNRIDHEKAVHEQQATETVPVNGHNQY
ncbi:hypothetical protein BU23DRAFT_578331 [Bimuria novae-zelandiae CBS 107.79]|uniref:MARVEL domain-containing protein n=1 Tax=Bimuria novae-zelandiae CBS 107.79 TaxID=1447943 RepID=A0A6A5VHS6_9PLEO|nr:hypothetical protein BU23DRAFT_578331 [Bimuria novae-zelandiae CBS 107.79]